MPYQTSLGLKTIYFLIAIAFLISGGIFFLYEALLTKDAYQGQIFSDAVNKPETSPHPSSYERPSQKTLIGDDQFIFDEEMEELKKLNEALASEQKHLKSEVASLKTKINKENVLKTLKEKPKAVQETYAAKDAYEEFLANIRYDLRQDHRLAFEGNKLLIPVDVFFQYHDIHIKDSGIQYLQTLSKIIQKRSKIITPYADWEITIETPIMADISNISHVESESILTFQKTMYLSNHMIALGFPPHRLSTITRFDVDKNISEADKKVILSINLR